MAIRWLGEPQLDHPVMLCGWPGIGNIGITAVGSLRAALKAEEFAEVEPYEFFYPSQVVIREGLLESLEFPSSKFYFRRGAPQDLVFFIGEQQPQGMTGPYAEGRKAYAMAELVLDVAQKLGCGRIYTSGAAVAQIHHTARPQVWAVPNALALIDEITKYENTVLMSGVEESRQQGTISGLNGLLLGVARERGIEAVCLMGEIPYYLQGAPWPYPKGSVSVVEVLAALLGVDADVTHLEQWAKKIERSIDQFLQNLYEAEGVPDEVKQQIEGLRHARQARLGPITDDEQKRIVEHIDELFRGEEGGGKRHI